MYRKRQGKKVVIAAHSMGGSVSVFKNYAVLDFAHIDFIRLCWYVNNYGTYSILKSEVVFVGSTTIFYGRNTDH